MLDLANYLVLGGLLAYLLYGLLPERFMFSRAPAGYVTAGLMCLQFVCVRELLSYSDRMKQILYGGDVLVLSSRQSILPVAVRLGATLLSGVILYRGSRIKLLSLVTAYYALSELTCFTFYSGAIWSINCVSDRIYHAFLENKMGDAEVKRAFEHAEIWFNVAVTVLGIFLLSLCVLKYKEYMKKGEKMYRRTEAKLLMVPSVTGLTLGLMLRCILFRYKEREIFSIVQEYPELNLIIPCMSLLCIASVLLSAKLLSVIAAEQEMRRAAEIDRSRAAELEAHIRDMEEVYVGIRGMKHDMKNYIADVQALFARMAAGEDCISEELKQYMDSMEVSLEKLDRRYRTGNPVTDVIVERYVRLFRQREIRFSCEFFYPKHMGIDVFDISVILNNALENAMEACMRQLDETERYVTLNAERKGNMFLMMFENSCCAAINIEGTQELPDTEKSGGNHGFGLKNMLSCAEKYYGSIKLRAKDGRFCLTVLLQGIRDEEG